MEARTRRNGGEAPLQSVADAWKAEEHAFHWSDYPEDRWAVELGHKLHDAEVQARASRIKTLTKH